MKIFRVWAVSALMLTVSGCSIQEVKPWQRGDLSRPEMDWNSDANTSIYRDHVHFSKEASSGGATAGGGGCGCN